METLRDFQLQRFNELKAQQSGYLPYWRDLSDYVDPTTSRYLATDRNRNTRNLRNPKVVNGRATLARETLIHGLMSGVTNPARPWFQFRAQDPDLNKYRAVKVYLDTVRQRMAEVFLKSNLYTTLPLIYSGISTHATAAFEIMDSGGTRGRRLRRRGRSSSYQGSSDRATESV